MNVLVTGGAGFIGSHLCERLLSEGHNVCAIDNFDDYYDPAIKQRNLSICRENPKFRLVEGDIRSRKSMDDAIEGIDIVFHEAAQAGVRASVKNPEKTGSINVGGLINVLEASRDANVNKIIFASSSSVYGKVHYLPFDEKHPLEPISPYGVTKLAGEHFLRVYGELYGIEWTALRYFTVYGPRVRPDLAINKFFRKAMKDESLDIYGDGTKTRDFTYISDIIDGTMLAMKKGRGAYNLGGGNRISIKDLAEIIKKIAESKSELKFTDNQQGDVRDTHSDTHKAKKELGWIPKVGIEEGLDKYYKWIIENS